MAKKTAKKAGGRRGRPPVPKAQRKSVVLCTRVDAASLRNFQAAARSAGVPLTEWVRDRLMKAAR